MKRYRLAVVASHVIQYQDPLFRLISQRPEIDLTVLFCSPKGFETALDAGMGLEMKWDLDLLEGYHHEFVPNWSPVRRSEGFLRIFNPGIGSKIRKGGFDAVLVMIGWGTVTSWLVFRACSGAGIPVLLHGDSAFVPDDRGFRGQLRDRVLRRLFRRMGGFMITGTMNAGYYLHYGADSSRFFPMPWAIDNERFIEGSTLDPDERNEVRRRFGIPEPSVAIVFSGKLIRRKNPDHLIETLARMTHRNAAVVVFMGDGEERPALERRAAELGLDERVVFTGFVNQKEIPRIYGACDIFVLPSSFDPRGTVTNEAMACGLPVVVSDRVGVWGEGDIVRNGETGFVYDVENLDELRGCLDRLVADVDLRMKMGAKARAVISEWSYEQNVQGLVAGLHDLASRTPIGRDADD